MGKLPFKDVYFTGLIRDSQGRKMSKSLNNGIDPLEVIDNYGADALRFTLVTGNSPGNDMRFYMERVEANRNFANKLWNATRFIFMNLKEEKIKDIKDVKLEVEDKWIISELNSLIKNVDQNIDKYEIGLAADKIYDFIWNEFCDWYIELVKPRLYEEGNEESEVAAQSTLIHVLDKVIKLLHPFMPYITEEIYSIMPNKKDMLINETWPEYDDSFSFEKEVEEIEILIETTKSIRNARAELDIAPSKKAELFILVEEDVVKSKLENISHHFKTVASVSETHFADKDLTSEDSISIVQNGFKGFIPLDELIDYNKELDRLTKEQDRLAGEIKRAEGKLSNKNFVDKAPEKVVAEEREKLEKYISMKEEVDTALQKVREKVNEI